MPTAIDEVKAIDAAIERHAAELTELSKSFEIKADSVDIPPKVLERIAEIKAANGGLRAARETFTESKSLLEWSRGGNGPTAAGADAAAAHNGELNAAAAMQLKSLGHAFTDSEIFAEMRERGLYETPRPYQVKAANIGALWRPGPLQHNERGELERKDIYTAAGGTFTSPAFGTQQNDGLILPAYRTTRVRDLFPQQATTANLIEYVRRTGYVNNARVVAERTAADGTAATGGPTDVFGLKPPSNLSYTSQQAAVRVIAHTIDVSKTVLDDVPRLQDTINGEMLYGLRLTEDAELLFGDGTGAHLLGIMNTVGIQAYSYASGPASDYMSDTVRRSLTLVQLAYYESTGVVLHPLDWEAMELTKDQYGRYVLVTTVTSGAQKMVWANPVVATPAMTQGRFLAGAFGLGAKLYDREQANIAISTETRDLFDRNAVAIRAEERVALEVARPEAFVKGTFRPAA